MKVRTSILLPVTLFLSASIDAQTIGNDVKARLKQDRTVTIFVRSEPPAWMNYDQLLHGYGFLTKHRETIRQVFGTTTFAATYASKDLVPVIEVTHRKDKDFSGRFEATKEWLLKIFARPTSRDEFIQNNYQQAIALGAYHRGIVERVKGDLNWDPKVRVPVNQQSYAFVLYNIAWWPVEAMIAKHQVDPKRDIKELDGWFHLWSVVGYGMGVDEPLLPQSYERAKAMVPLISRAQYFGYDVNTPQTVANMLGLHVRSLATTMAPKGSDPAAIYPMVCRVFADLMSLSPGMSKALGLGADPAADLLKDAQRIDARK